MVNTIHYVSDCMNKVFTIIILTKYKINDKENFKITNKPNCKRKKKKLI